MAVAEKLDSINAAQGIMCENARAGRLGAVL